MSTSSFRTSPIASSSSSSSPSPVTSLRQPAGLSPPPPPDIALAPNTGSAPSLREEEADHDKHELSVGEWAREVVMDNQVVINTFIAGGLAGATSRTVVSPLERLKIILQCQAATGTGTTGQAYSGVWASLGRMWREEGFRGFMKGNGINVVRILPYSALQFTSYGGFKKLLGEWSGQESLSTPLRLTAGAGAGILAVSATYPLDLVRARLSIATANMATRASTPAEVAKRAFSAEDAKLGMFGMTKKVYMTEGGIRGLYRGCWATAVGVAPYVSLNFYIYETLKTLILPPELSPDAPSVPARKLLCGAMAGATSLIFTHPFDVLRRKLQVSGIGGGKGEYDGAVDAIRKIVRTEGFWKGMYRGLVPNIIKVTPSIAVSFYTFETVRDALAKWEDLDDGEDQVV